MRFFRCFGKRAIAPCCTACHPLFAETAGELLLTNRQLKEARDENVDLKLQVRNLKRHIVDITSMRAKLMVIVENEDLKKKLTNTHADLARYRTLYQKGCEDAWRARDEAKAARDDRDEYKQTASDLKKQVELLEIKNAESAVLLDDMDRLRAETARLKEFVSVVEMTTAAGWFDEQLCAFEEKAEAIIQQCYSVADGLVDKIKDACAVESAYPRVHRCPVCCELKGSADFSLRNCGHGVCTECTATMPVENRRKCEVCRRDSCSRCALFVRVHLP